MIAGLAFIVAGILIAVFPELLSLIVAIILVSTGITLLTLRYHMRKLEREWQNPVIEFFMRY